MNSTELGEACRLVIKADRFVDATVDDLDPWTAGIVRSFLESANLKWQIAASSVGPVRIIKIFDDKLKYVLSMPYKSYDEQICDQFYWLVGDDPNNDDHSIHPDVASAYLMSKTFPGIKIQDIRKDDGSCLTRMTLPDGRHIEVVFPPGFLSNKTYARD